MMLIPNNLKRVTSPRLQASGQSVTMSKSKQVFFHFTELFRSIDMGSLAISFEKLLDANKSNRQPGTGAPFKVANVRDDLNPGASTAELKELVDAVGFEPHNELCELLQINNGQRGFGSPILGGFYFFSIQQILNSWYEHTGISSVEQKFDGQDDRIQPNVFWSKRWIPIGYAEPFELVLDCCPTESGTNGQILFYDHESPPGPVIAHSLCGFFETAIKNMDKRGRFSIGYSKCETPAS